MSTRRTGHERILGWLVVFPDCQPPRQPLTSSPTGTSRRASRLAQAPPLVRPFGHAGHCDGAHRHPRRYPGVPGAVRNIQRGDPQRRWLSNSRRCQSGARRAGQPLSGPGGGDRDDLSELPEREWTVADRSGRARRATGRRATSSPGALPMAVFRRIRKYSWRSRAGRVATDTAGTPPMSAPWFGEVVPFAVRDSFGCAA